MPTDSGPDTISSDLHRFNVDGPVFDLVTTLSKFLLLGLSVPEVIAMATTEPAAAMGRTGVVGTLTPGAEADVAVLRYDETPVELIGQRRGQPDGPGPARGGNDDPGRASGDRRLTTQVPSERSTASSRPESALR